MEQQELKEESVRTSKKDKPIRHFTVPMLARAAIPMVLINGGHSFSEIFAFLTDYGFPFSRGSIHPALAQLVSEGTIESHVVDHPDKQVTLYRLTPTGRSAAVWQCMKMARFAQACAPFMSDSLWSDSDEDHSRFASPAFEDD
jgi:Transcriptional regulator PadR-like family